jgi:glc operon protein GlcG
MRSIVSLTLAACAIAVMSSPTLAQAQAQAQAQVPAPAAAPATPPAPPSAGGTPDAMPFDIPYGQSIGLEHAKQVMAAAEAEAKKRNWKMNIAVVDTNGELVQFERMEGAQIASGSISVGKARTAARFRRESRLFYNAFETGHGYVSTLDPTLVASPGGFPLVEGGKLIGAVGCSGGTGDQDAVVCKAGAEVVK